MTDEFSRLFPAVNDITAHGDLRTVPEDFRVTECIEVTFSGQGEHLWLNIQKTGCNTHWVAQQLAAACGVAKHQVGYAGLKDRHAVTSQWFSVQLPDKDNPEDIQACLPDQVVILQAQRHHKKLKTGGLRANRFELFIRNMQGDRQQIEQNLAGIRNNGVPNYFSVQRFGRNMNNVPKAEAWFKGDFRPKGRQLKGLLLSAARSWIFNHIVARRIKGGIWDKPVDGDVFQLNGSRSWFKDDHGKDGLQQIRERLSEHDIHITAALWGDDELPSTQLAAQLENDIAGCYPGLLAGIRRQRMAHDRRAIRLLAGDLSHRWSDNDLALSFELPAGCYATSVISEICSVSDCSQSAGD